MTMTTVRARPGAPSPAPPRPRPSSASALNFHGDDGGRLTHCLSASLRDLMFGDDGATQSRGGEAERLYRSFLNSPTRPSPATAGARERRRLGDRRKWIEDAEAAMGVGSNGNALGFLRERIRRRGAGSGSGEEGYADGRYMIWMVREVLMGPLMQGEDGAIEEDGGDEGDVGEGWVAALESWNDAIVELLTRTCGDEENAAVSGTGFFLAEEEDAEDENSVDVMWRGLLRNAHLSPASLRKKLEKYVSPQEDYEANMGNGADGASLPSRYFHWPSFFRQAATEAAEEHSKENGAGGANKRRMVNREDFLKPRTSSSLLGEEGNRDWWPLLGYAVARALLSSEHPPSSVTAHVNTGRRVEHLRRDVMRSLPATMGVGNFDFETRGSLLAGMGACILDEVGDWTVLDGLALEQAEGRVRTPEGGGRGWSAAEEELRMNEEVCDRMRADVSQISDVLLVDGVLPKLAKLIRVLLSDLVAESADGLLNYSLVHHRLRNPNPPPDEDDDPLPRLLAEDARYVVRFIEKADPSLKRQLANHKFTRDSGVATGVAPGFLPFHPIIVSIRARLLTNDTPCVSNTCSSLEDCAGIDGAIKQHCWWMLFEKMQDEGTLFEEGWNLTRATDVNRGTATLANITLGQIGKSCALDYLENVVLEAKDALSSRSRTFQTPIAIKHARIARNRHEEEDQLAEEELLCVKDAVRRTVLKLLLPRAYSPGEALRIATERSSARDPPELDHTKWGWNGVGGDPAVAVACRILAAPSMYSVWNRRLVDEEDAKALAEEFEEDELLDAEPSEKSPARDAIAEELAEATVVKEIELPQKESQEAVQYANNTTSPANEAEKHQTEDKKDEVIDLGDFEEEVQAQESPAKAKGRSEATADSPTQEGSTGGQKERDGITIEEDVEDEEEEIDRTGHLAAEITKHQYPGNYSESDDYDAEDNKEADRHMAFEGDYEEEEGQVEILSSSEESEEEAVVEGTEEEDPSTEEEKNEADALNEKVERYVTDHGGADDSKTMPAAGSGAAHDDGDGERQREREEAGILREAVRDYIVPSSRSKESSKLRRLEEEVDYVGEVEVAPEAAVLHEDDEGENNLLAKEEELLLVKKENPTPEASTLVEKGKLVQNDQTLAAGPKKPDANEEKPTPNGKEQKAIDTRQKGSKSIEGKEDPERGMEFDEEELFAAATTYTDAARNIAGETTNMNKCCDGMGEDYERGHGQISAASSGVLESGDEAVEQMEHAGFSRAPFAASTFDRRLVDESANLHRGERVEKEIAFGNDRVAVAPSADEMSRERERQSERVDEEDVVDYDYVSEASGTLECEEEGVAAKILADDEELFEATAPDGGKEKAAGKMAKEEEMVVDYDHMSVESSLHESEDDAMEEGIQTSGATEIVARDQIEVLDEDEAEEGEILSDDRGVPTEATKSTRHDDYPCGSVRGIDDEKKEIDKADLYSQGEEGEASGYGRKPAVSDLHTKDEDVAQEVPTSHRQKHVAIWEGNHKARADDNDDTEGSEQCLDDRILQEASAPLTKLDERCKSAEQSEDEVVIFDLDPTASVPKVEPKINLQEAAEDKAKGIDETIEDNEEPFAASEQEPFVEDDIDEQPLAEELGMDEEAKTRGGRVQKEHTLKSPTKWDIDHLPKDYVSVEVEKPMVAIGGDEPTELGCVKEEEQELDKLLEDKGDAIAGEKAEGSSSRAKDNVMPEEDAPIHLSVDGNKIIVPRDTATEVNVSVEDDVNMLADDEHESIDTETFDETDGGGTERPSFGNIGGAGVPLAAANANYLVEQQQQQPSVLVAAAMSTQRQQLEAARQEVAVGENQSLDNTSAALASTDANLWENYDEASQGDGTDVDRANVQVVARYHGHDLKALGSVLDVHADADDDSAEDSSQENKKKGQMTDDGYNPDESEATEEERRPNRKKAAVTDVRAIDDGYDPDAEATEEERHESKSPKKEERVADSKPVIDEGYIPDASEASEVEQPEENSTIKRPVPGANNTVKRDVRFKEATSMNDDHTIPVNDLSALASQSTIDEGYIPTDEGLTEEEKGRRRGSSAAQRLVASSSLTALDEGYVPDDALTEEERIEKNTPRRPKLHAGVLTDDGYIPDAEVTEEDRGEIMSEKRLKQQHDAVNQDDQSEMKMSSRDEEDGLLEHNDVASADKIDNYDKEVASSVPTEKMLDDTIDEGYLPSAVEGTEEERSEAEEDTRAVMAVANSMPLGSFSANAINKEEETHAEQQQRAIPSVLVATATALQQQHGSVANTFLSMQGPDKDSGAEEKILVESEPAALGKVMAGFKPDEEDENVAVTKYQKEEESRDVMAVEEVESEVIIMERKVEEQRVMDGSCVDEESGDYSKRTANAEEKVSVTGVKCEKEEESQDVMAVDEVGSEVIIIERKVEEQSAADGASADKESGDDFKGVVNAEEEVLVASKVAVTVELLAGSEPDKDDEKVAVVKYETAGQDVIVKKEDESEVVTMGKKLEEEMAGSEPDNDDEKVAVVKYEKEGQDVIAKKEDESEVVTMDKELEEGMAESAPDEDGEKVAVVKYEKEGQDASKKEDQSEVVTMDKKLEEMTGSEPDKDDEKVADVKHEKEGQDVIAKKEDQSEVVTAKTMIQNKEDDELDPVAVLVNIAPTVAHTSNVNHIEKEEKFTVAVPEGAPTKFDTLTANESHDKEATMDKSLPISLEEGDDEMAKEASFKEEKMMETVAATGEVVTGIAGDVDEAKEDSEAGKHGEKHAGRREAEDSTNPLQESATAKTDSATPMMEKDPFAAADDTADGKVPESEAGVTKNVGEVREDFSRLKVKQLQSRLRQLNLPVSGRKQELIDRLNGHLYPGETGDDDASGISSKALTISSRGRPKTSVSNIADPRQHKSTPSSSKLASSSRSRRGKKQLEDTPISELSHPIDSDIEDDDDSVQERHFSSEGSNSKRNSSSRRGGKNDGPSPGVPKEVFATSKGKKNPPSMPAVPEGEVVEGVKFSTASADIENLKSEVSTTKSSRSKRSKSRRTKKDDSDELKAGTAAPSVASVARKGSKRSAGAATLDGDEGVVASNPPQKAKRSTRATAKRREDGGTDEEVSDVDVKEKKEFPKKRGRGGRPTQDIKDDDEESVADSAKRRSEKRQKKNLEEIDEENVTASVSTAVKKARLASTGTSRRATRGTAKKAEGEETSTAKRSTRGGASKRKAEEESVSKKAEGEETSTAKRSTRGGASKRKAEEKSVSKKVEGEETSTAKRSTRAGASKRKAEEKSVSKKVEGEATSTAKRSTRAGASKRKAEEESMSIQTRRSARSRAKK